MGLFNRQPRDGGPSSERAPRAARAPRQRNEPYYSMSTRPTFGQWLKYTWLDIVTMAAMGAIGLGVS